jgi:putative flavoprotein involved in K+ transport
MWTRTGQSGLWFTGGSFSQCRIYSRFIALQIDAIETGRLEKAVKANQASAEHREVRHS